MYAIVLADPEAWSEPNGLEGLEFENGEGRQLGQGYCTGRALSTPLANLPPSSRVLGKDN